MNILDAIKLVGFTMTDGSLKDKEVLEKAKGDFRCTVRAVQDDSRWKPGEEQRRIHCALLVFHKQLAAIHNNTWETTEYIYCNMYGQEPIPIGGGWDLASEPSSGDKKPWPPMGGHRGYNDDDEDGGRD